MPQSLTRLYYHVVFSTKHRELWIDDAWRPELHAYIGGVLRNRRCELIAAGGIEDNTHLLIRARPIHAVSELIRDVKSNSSGWRHDQGDARFHWQDGYGAFSVSPTEVEGVIAYIAYQREHHRTVTFQEEYLECLRVSGVDECDERYVWD